MVPQVWWWQEFPYVRYRQVKPPADGSDYKVTARDLVPTKLAAALWDCLMKYRSSLIDFPNSETCELVIVDRAIDPVSNFIPKFGATLWEMILQSFSSLVSAIFQYETPSSLINKPGWWQVAPIIHEWTYDAICNDILDIDGNKYAYEVLVVKPTYFVAILPMILLKVIMFVDCKLPYRRFDPWFLLFLSSGSQSFCPSSTFCAGFHGLSFRKIVLYSRF